MARLNNRVQRNRETLVLPIFLFILLSPYLLFSQYYNAGVDNSKIRWKEIDTENYQLIFPDYYEEKAREYARLIDFYSPYITRSLKTELPKIPIIIPIMTMGCRRISRKRMNCPMVMLFHR